MKVDDVFGVGEVPISIVGDLSATAHRAVERACECLLLELQHPELSHAGA